MPDDKPFRRSPSPKLRIAAELDNRGVLRDCTVRIHRGAKVISVRPLHSRKTYEATLADVARWIYRREISRLVQEKKQARRSRRRS